VSLTKGSRLRLAPDLAIEVRGAEVTMRVGDARLRGDLELLDVLAAFRVATALDAAVTKLAASRGLDGWARLAARIHELVSVGVLVDESKGAVLDARPGRFGSAASQVRMLDDEARTSALVGAVRAAVRPDDVVLDLGTGTGLLALAALQAGARRVFAIEETAIASAAEAVFRGEPRITLLRGNSRELSLDEPATLLVSEILGDEPLAERVLEAFADARARLLAPGARILPRRLRILARGVELDPATQGAHRFEERAIRRWSDLYGLDLGPLVGVGLPEGYRTVVTQETATRFTPRTAAVELASLDLASAPTTLDVSVSAECLAGGALDAVVTWFEAELDDERTLSSEPGRIGASRHWNLTVWFAPRDMRLDDGDGVALRYVHGPSGTRLTFRP
jgi:protein arginine N-methyltransferase 1